MEVIIYFFKFSQQFDWAKWLKHVLLKWKLYVKPTSDSFKSV